MDLYPLKFEPLYLEKIWGGRNLERLFARRLPAGRQIGESWELADLPEGVSVLSNGPLAGRTLTDLTARLGGQMLGDARPMPDGRFPLLLKLLDANEVLSLQVHPDNPAASQIAGAAAKNECWYVIESRDGMIFKDLLPGVSLDQFAQALRSACGPAVEGLVRRLNVAAGDFHYLPAGMLHALGKGVVVAEVQTPSDTTYRVSDWGRGRELHLDLSLRCVRLGLPGAAPAGELLLDGQDFRVSRRSAGAGQVRALPAGCCTAMMFLECAGPCEVRHDGRAEPRVGVVSGETVLLPAALERPVLQAGGACRWLEIALPTACPARPGRLVHV